MRSSVLESLSLVRNLIYTMDVPTNHIENSNSDLQPNKRRRKKSIVWDHFTIETINADCIRALCKQCKKSFAYISGSKLSGTSHLKRHISLGICPVSRCNEEKNQLHIFTPDAKSDVSENGTVRTRKRYRANPGPASISFDQDLCCHEIAKMIIQHEYPLRMVEDSGFIDFARCLHPHFNAVSTNTVQEYIMGIYFREKQKLLNLVTGIAGRVSLTLDLWTSDQRVSYGLLTGHFIGCDWKLHRRIFNVAMLPYPDSETSFIHAIASSLNDWGSESKLFTLTLDQFHTNENAKRNLRGLLSIKNSRILTGQLLINSCYTCTLTRLAQDAVGFIQETVQKVRDSVKYVKISEVREERFIKLKQQLQVPSTKNLIVDDLTKWNTTYHMLMAASELKEVFSCLDTSDPDYKSTPTMDEWRQVETLCTYLKIFYEAANILTSPLYPTTNTFFHELWKIQLELMHAVTSPDLFVSNLTRPLHEKFTRYWEDCNLVLAVAVVMDPRFKMKLVEFSFSRIYGEDADNWIKIVDEDVHELYLEYVVQCLPPPTFIGGNEAVAKTEIPQEEGGFPNGDIEFSDYDIYISDIMNGQQMKSELDQYLEESLLPRVQDFDVLGWWRVNRSKYPTLSKMACDVLSIPVSTVPPYSVFDTRTRKMNSYRSSLRPTVLEALICAKDWLQYEHSEMSFGITEVPSTVVKTDF
ncbi:zinc finger BED domain-containing DAYSLEEPER-like isoform X2, partial [Olea europaea subsp. europaea]